MLLAVFFLQKRLDRAQQQRQRGSQFVAHIGEESRLGLIEFLEIFVGFLQAESQRKVASSRCVAGIDGKAGEDTCTEDVESGRQSLLGEL